MSERASQALSLASRLLDPPWALALDPRQDPLSPPLRPGAPTLAVLDVTKWFGATSGGVRTYLLQKAAYVERHQRLRQIIVVPGRTDLCGSTEGVRCYQIRSPAIPRYAPYRLLHDWRALRRITAHERPSIVEVGSPLLVPWLAERAVRNLGIPLVCFHHGLLPYNLTPRPANASAIRRKGVSATWAYLRRLDRLFARTIVGSEYAADELRRHGVGSAVRIPLGVDLDLFHPRRRAHADSVRSTLGIPHGPVAGYLGRLSIEKSLDVLVAAWQTVRRRTGATLVLAGDGPLRRELATAGEEAGVCFVPFIHRREDAADFLAALDLYVSPGPVETFGLSALEAMASGTPVLSVEHGGAAELVRRSGAGGVYEVDSPASVASAAEELLTADVAAYGRAGRAYAEREHSWQFVFERLFTLYSDVIAESAA